MADDSSTADPVLTRLTADMKTAMKAGEKDRLQVIRMLLTEARSADMQNPPSTPQAMVEAYEKRLVKGRAEFEKVGNADELAKLDAELKVVAEYTPKKASAAETLVLVDDFLAQHPELAGGDVGKATGLFMKQHGKNADAKAANRRIREVLQSR